jgi:glutamate 5-kinase
LERKVYFSCLQLEVGAIFIHIGKRILVIFDGEMNNFVLDLVMAQEIQALLEAGHEVDLVSRGTLNLPGCVTIHIVIAGPGGYPG